MATRRAHTKSRAGCQQCKRRKVKCDEKRPSCFNCTRYDTLCSFSYPDSSACPTCGQSRKRLGLHGPLKDANTSQSGSSPVNCKLASSLDSSDKHTPQDHVDAFLHAVYTSSLPISERPTDTALLDLRRHDFELIHHFLTATYLTMGLQDDLRSVWKTAIPQQGYSHPYVMHGIMALSALHKAYLLNNKADKYLTLAAYHYTRGQADFRKDLLAVTDENCKPVFCFSLILIVYMCSVPVTRDPRHVIENPIQATLEWFLVCRGLRETTKSYYDRALKSDLFPLVRSSWLTGDDDPLKIPTPSLQNSPLPADTFEAIDHLKDFLQTHVDMMHIAETEDALSCLRLTVMNVAMAGINVELGNVVLWPHHFSDAFMADMKQLRPYALLILAYFTPILAVVDRNFWFLHGWSKYLLADIEHRLRDLPEFARNLDWPKAHITGI